MASRPRVAIAAIADLAARQSWLLTSAQIDAAGIARSTVARDPAWGRVLPGVHGRVDVPLDRCRAALAAQLSIGERCTATHLTSASIRDLDGVPPHAHIHVSGPIAGHRSVDWLRVHRREVPPETIVRSGLLVHTNDLRTRRYSCALLDELHIERMLESVPRKGTTLLEVEHWSAARGSGGRKRLSRVLAQRPTGAPPTGSELETRDEQLVRFADLPASDPAVRGDRRRVVVAVLDHAWPEYLAFTESDSKALHGGEGALYNDRQRQNDVVTKPGWRPIRVTWKDVTRHQTNTLRWTADVVRLGGVHATPREEPSGRGGRQRR